MAEVARDAPRAVGIDQQLDQCSFAWLEARGVLVGTASGQLLVATLPQEGGSVKRIQASSARHLKTSQQASAGKS